jgi:hypothetical protein
VPHEQNSGLGKIVAQLILLTAKAFLLDDVSCAGPTTLPSAFAPQSARCKGLVQSVSRIGLKISCKNERASAILRAGADAQVTSAHMLMRPVEGRSARACL